MPWLALVLCSLASAQTDFSGQWNLSLQRSDFGSGPSPASMTMRVEQEKDSVSVHSEITGAQGSYASAYKWITDGRENRNLIRGNQVAATATWRGETLYVKSRVTFQGAEIKTTDEWMLSENGTVLTIYRATRTPNREVEQKLVYLKAPNAH